MGLGRVTSNYSLTRTCTKPNNKLVSALSKHFGARMSHGRLWTHKTHHGLNLGETTTFPLIVYFALLLEAHIQMVFYPGTPILPRLEFPRLCGAITLCADLWLEWGLKQSCSPRQELSNGKLHATCTQGNRVDSWLLMVGSQIVNLTPSLSFGPNGSYKLILDIYVSIAFQWYKKLFNSMGFYPCNRSLKILGVHRDSNS
jgi:hypothetical protein